MSGAIAAITWGKSLYHYGRVEKITEYGWWRRNGWLLGILNADASVSIIESNVLSWASYHN